MCLQLGEARVIGPFSISGCCFILPSGKAGENIPTAFPDGKIEFPATG
jgi:hypothetical protein